MGDAKNIACPFGISAVCRLLKTNVCFFLMAILHAKDPATALPLRQIISQILDLFIRLKSIQ